MRNQTLGILLVLTVAGAVLRIWAATKTEFDSDDPLSLLQASGNYAAFRDEIPPRVVPAAYFRDIMIPREPLSLGRLYAGRDPNHPVLYFVFLHHWILLVEYSLFKACLPAVVFGVLAIPLFYLVCVRILPERDALMAAAFLAVSGMFIYLSSLIRHYSFLLFVGSAFTYFALRLHSAAARRRTDYLFLILCGLAGIWGHYLFVLILVPVNLFYLWSSRREGRKLGGWLACQAVLLLGAVPEIAGRLSTGGRLRPPDQVGLTETANAVYRGALAYFYRYQVAYASRLDQVLGLGLSLAVIVLVILFLKSGENIRRRSLVVLILLINFLLFPLLGYALQVSAYIHQPKYLLFGGIALFIAAAGGLGRIRIAWLRWLLFAALSAGALSSWKWAPVPSSRDFAFMARYIGQRSSPGDVVVIDNTKPSFLGRFAVHFMDRDIDLLAVPADRLGDLLRAGQPVELFRREKIFYLRNLVGLPVGKPDGIDYFRELIGGEFDELKENRFRHFTSVFEYRRKSPAGVNP